MKQDKKARGEQTRFVFVFRNSQILPVSCGCMGKVKAANKVADLFFSRKKGEEIFSRQSQVHHAIRGGWGCLQPFRRGSLHGGESKVGVCEERRSDGETDAEQ